MNKNAIVTICMGEKYQKIGELTHPTIQSYAEKIGADFIVLSEKNIAQTTPHWEKFAIKNFLNKYHRIIYFDTDIIIREDCPDLFGIVPEDSLGVFNEAPFTDGRVTTIYQACKEYETTLPNWDGQYFNSGVMVVSRYHKDLFKKPEKEIFNFYEQSYLNIMIAKMKIKTFEITHKFNRMCCMDGKTGEERFDSYAIHYAGVPDVSILPGLIAKDLEKWKNDAPEFKYQRHILIDVQGGLGDQIDAGPTIRYLLKYIYPNDDVRIVTHFPRVFQHINAPVYLHGELKKDFDGEFYHVVTLPGPETPMWTYVSNLLCHTVDFVSIAVLRRTLPDKDKEIQLDLKVDDIDSVNEIVNFDSLEDVVLVHAGRHWESKTFPVEWWQKIIDGLHEKGLKVCLIGKEEETRGTLNVEVRDGMIDLRNLLSLGELFAVISQAKVLVSNDSSPIHIAGAFDNQILLIPSCKNPDHILPWRNGDKNYKSKALFKELSLDDIPSAPTEIYGQTAEFLVRDWYEYLPNPEEVVDCAEKMFIEESQCRGLDEKD